MKKFTLVAFAAAATLGASAQYTTATPYMEPIVKAGAKVLDAIVCDNASLDAARAAGVKVNDYRVDDVNRFFYIWDGTFEAGDGSYPGIGYNDFQFDGYTAVNVTTMGWSGAGFCFVVPGDLSHFNENTRFHVAYRSQNAPNSIALIIADGKQAGATSAPAKVALGDPFNDNGAIYPAIGPKASEEWQAIDISFSDLKKLYPSFDFNAGPSWEGNILAILAGGVQGTGVSLDAVYFYSNSEGSGVEAIENDAEFFVTRNTVNSTVNGIELYDLAGRRVAATAGTVLGLDELSNGVYVAKSGKKAQKVVVR